MNYKDLNLSFNQQYFQVVLPDGKTSINVKTYLPIQQKKDLIQITLQKAEESNGLYNEILVDMYFHLFLIFSYTDIVFTEEDREDLFLLYDELVSSGILDIVIQAIYESQYDELIEYLKATRQSEMKYKYSTAAIVEKIIGDLPKAMQQASQIIDNFDPQKYKEVIAFSKAANGGRDIDYKNVEGV